jgi:hypothetical protein
LTLDLGNPEVFSRLTEVPFIMFHDMTSLSFKCLQARIGGLAISLCFAASAFGQTLAPYMMPTPADGSSSAGDLESVKRFIERLKSDCGGSLPDPVLAGSSEIPATDRAVEINLTPEFERRDSVRKTTQQAAKLRPGGLPALVGR